MQSFAHAREPRLACAFVGVTLFAVGFLPLFGGPGYEQSLASGLLVPSAAGVATACELSRDHGDVPSPIACVGRGIQTGLVLAGIAFATALVHGLRVGMCDLPGGALSFALTALIGSVLGGVWGSVVAEVARGRKRRRLLASALAIGLPLASALVSVGRFYTSPMIFAFDPFVGYFSGTLYDTVVDAGNALITYRVGSLATLVGTVFLATLLTRTTRASGEGKETLGFVRIFGQGALPGARARFALMVVGFVTSLGVTLNGPTLGHWETSSTIARELGGSRAGKRCDVVYPDSLLPDEVALLVKDCDEQLLAVERTLGTHGPDRIRAFFFRDSNEKKRLMGAADTLIAKPWREEVYVQLSTYPHPVLGHELAHVIAGSFGQGPFHIAGSAHGLWPDPGRIEGIAVAASPDDDELSNAQWAHAMKDLGSLPSIEKVFSLGFLNVAASKSYTLAGAFVRYAMDAYGVETVRRWYGGASLVELTGKSWSTLDEDFRAYVDKTTLSPEAQAFAKARFDRPAVFGRTCPHVVDGLRRKADMCRDAHQTDKAREAYSDVLQRDPHDWGAKYGLATVSLRYGPESDGVKALSAMAEGDETPRTWRDRAKDALADALVLNGDEAGARQVYVALAARSLDEDFARTCDVKATALVESAGRAAIVPLLIGAPERPADALVASERVGEWAAVGSPLAAYLAGRNFVSREWFFAAVPLLEQALAGRAMLPLRVVRETLRLRAVVACALGDATAVQHVQTEVLSHDGPFEGSTGRRLSLLRFLDRCTVSPPAP